MTDQEPRLQPGVTPGHRALLVEATEAAKAFPGVTPERLAEVIATGLAASRPRGAERYLVPCCEEPEAEPDDEAEWDSADSNAYQARVEAGLEPEAEP